MSFCPKCGRENAATAAFCSNCGTTLDTSATQPGTQSPNTPVSAKPQTQTGLQPNVAGLLCYLFAWITGLIFFFIEKDRFVRFHAMQSIIVFGGLQVLQIVLGIVLVFVPPLLILVNLVIGVGSFVLWILLMVKAYNGEQYKLPTIGDLAEKWSAQ
ncbi:MAG: DUF4870 domain-containing protein [Mycobacterium leprae]